MSKFILTSLLALSFAVTPVFAATKVTAVKLDKPLQKIEKVEEAKIEVKEEAKSPSFFRRIWSRVTDSGRATVKESPKDDSEDMKVVPVPVGLENNSLAIISSNPPSGATDAREPWNPDGSGFWKNWQMIEVTWNGPASNLSAADFEVTSTGDYAPQVVGVIPSATAANTTTLVLQYPIAWNARTIIKHKLSGSIIDLAYLSGDVNGDRVVNGFDMLAFIDWLNGVKTLPSYSTDINMSGQSNQEDMLRLIDLFNGADRLDVQYGKSLQGEVPVENQ